MNTNVTRFPQAPTLSRKVAFTPSERTALIACAYGLPGGMAALFDTDDNGVEYCTLASLDTDEQAAFVGLEAGEMILWDGPMLARVTTRDVRDIVAAIVEDFALFSQDQTGHLESTSRATSLRPPQDQRGSGTGGVPRAARAAAPC